MKAPLQNAKTSDVNTPAQRMDKATQPIVNNRPQAAAQRKMQEAINNSPRQVAQRQRVAQLQAAAQTRPNRTGLPDKLKAGVENLSGYSLDDVQVHYNSAEPAQLQALAYAEGTDIHIAPGQEKHLPHEAWHVVQQKQGRVRTTTQLKGVRVNDDEGLEREADVMGERAARQSNPEAQSYQPASGAAPINWPGANVVQRAVGLEFQTYKSGTKLQTLEGDNRDNWKEYTTDKEEVYATGQGIKIEKDGADLEFVTNAFSESDSGRASLIKAMRVMIITAMNLENSETLTHDVAAKGPGLSRAADASRTTRVVAEGSIKAQPQATVGIDLVGLSPLLSALAMAGKRDSTESLSEIFAKEQARPESRKKGNPNQHHTLLAGELGKNGGDKTQIIFGEYTYPQADEFAKDVGKGSSLTMKGFLNLLGLYIYGGHTQGKYAKSRTPVISRTNLADVFGKLPEEDKIWFAGNITTRCKDYFNKNPKAGVSLEVPVYNKYPHGEKEASGISSDEVKEMTINRWLTGLIPKSEQEPGTDILAGLEGLGVISNANKSDAPDAADYQQKWFSNAYGDDLQMEESTDIGVRESLSAEGPAISPHRLNGIVLELRNLGNDNLDISEWASFAVSVFDLTVLVNSQNFKEVKALSKAMLAQRSFEADLGDVEMPGIFAAARQKLTTEKERVEKMLIAAALQQGISQEALTDALLHWEDYIQDLA